MDGTGRGQLIGYGVAVVLALIVGLKLLAPKQAEQAPPPVRIDGPAAARGSGGGSALYVHVAGEVRRPGLYRVPASARVAVALERAGGPRRRAELSAVNLAARVEDGQQIVVPRVGAAPAGAGAAAGGAAGATGAAGAKISLGTATPEQLDELDGIGETLAKRIIEYRDENGGFRSVAELNRVEGIGEKRFAALKDAVQP